jgi:amidase
MAQPHSHDPAWVPVAHDGGSFVRRAAIVVDDPWGLSSETVTVVRRAGQHLAAAGWIIEEVAPPRLEEMFEMWNHIGGPELRHLLAPLAPQLGDPGLSRFIENFMGAVEDAPITVYFDWMMRADSVGRAWQAFFSEYPLVVMPSLATLTMKVDADLDGVEELRASLRDFRYMFGLPSLRVPALQVPIDIGSVTMSGVQLVSGMFREDVCFAGAYDIERAEGERPVIDPRW